MLVQEQIDYVAANHKHASQSLKELVGVEYLKGVRVSNTSGSTVTLECKDGKNTFTLEFPNNFCGWEPSKITHILAGNTANDELTGVKINLLLV